MRRSLVPIIRVALLMLLVALLLVLASGYIYLARAFPSTNGTLHVAGLTAQASIVRDAQGLAQVYASNEHALFFAQGYLHAQDRLWQMDLNRHLGHGQLAELFGDIQFRGSSTVDLDKFFRTIGLTRAARVDLAGLSPATSALLSSYADGVNAFIHSHQDNLPLEFSLLDYRPSDWQPVDTVVWGKVMAYNLGGNYEAELLRARLIDRLGPTRAALLIPAYPATAPVIIPREVKDLSTAPSLSSEGLPLSLGAPDLDALAALNRAAGWSLDNGSNNWVVDGTRTTTGKPLLANDPHLGISMPAIWYANGLHCRPVSPACPLDVIGYTFPGAPGVVIGHNARIAWAVTNAGPDVQDLYVEKLNPSNPNQYLFRGEWQEVKAEQETIHVKGGADVPLTVRYTRHGPIMTPVLKGVTATLALQWTAIREKSSVLESVARLDAAQTWNDFREALRLWDAPAQNFLYADVDGNIGYQLPGLIPIRSRGDGLTPVDGASGNYEWSDYIPFDRLPSVLNPDSHLIVTANNKIVPDDYPYFIARDVAAPFRAQRILDLLQARQKLFPADFQAIQADVYSRPLMKLRGLIVPLSPDGFLAQRALAYVKDWDGNLTPDTIGGAILEVTYLDLARDLLAPVLGPDLFESYEQRGSGVHRLLIDGLLDDPNNALWDDPATPARETRDARLEQAFEQAVDWLGSQFGDWPPEWHWGRLHAATFSHPFGSIQPLDLLFNFGPLWAPGDSQTVDNAGFDDSQPFSVRQISSMREIVDLSNLDRSLWVHSTGQSGQPLNPHYVDLVNLWREVKYAPLYFGDQAVKDAKTGELVLLP